MALRDAKAVFFDVDDTLYDFERSMEFAFHKLRVAFPDVLGHHTVERMAKAYWSHYRGYDEQAKTHLINSDPDLFRRTMWAGALESLGLDAEDAPLSWLRREHPTVTPRFGHPDGFPRVLGDVFQKGRPDDWRAAMYEGARELLGELKARVILGAITNGPSPVQRPKLDALNAGFFPEHLTFVSGEFGARKPDPSIFLAAAKAAGVAPDSCVMVGDAREFDMPAKAVGFRTVLFDGKRLRPDCGSDAWPPDAIVHSYAELRRVLLG